MYFFYKRNPPINKSINYSATKYVIYKFGLMNLNFTANEGKKIIFQSFESRE